jgi:type IV pilus assembly protein PilC
MLFKYKAIDKKGEEKSGIIDALSKNVAVESLQNRGLIVSSVELSEKKTILQDLPFFNRVPVKNIVILSRQMSTLFEAQVSALRVFRFLSTETTNPILKKGLAKIADDLQEGSTISEALSRHPAIFSGFYVSMVKVGEESGKLDQVLVHLADYLDRTYVVTSKAKHALVYPALVIVAFIGVMTLMFVVIVPRISPILQETGTELPFSTRMVLGTSEFLINYGIFVIIGLIIAGFFLFKYFQTDEGKITLSNVKLSIPYVGNLYRKLYLSRISDNLNTMLSAGIPILQALENTSPVIGNEIYEAIIEEAIQDIKAGKSLSSVFVKHEDIPSIMTQMIRIGEESGELGTMLKTLSRFYEREVIQAVDTLVDLIQPAIILVLGLAVGFLLASVLLPIYNIAASF